MNRVQIRETLNGRPYLIEVLPLGRDHWRAQLTRRSGSTALMPFYGTTAYEAAQSLTRWLERASARVP